MSQEVSAKAVASEGDVPDAVDVEMQVRTPNMGAFHDVVRMRCFSRRVRCPVRALCVRVCVCERECVCVSVTLWSGLSGHSQVHSQRVFGAELAASRPAIVQFFTVSRSPAQPAPSTPTPSWVRLHERAVVGFSKAWMKTAACEGVGSVVVVVGVQDKIGVWFAGDETKEFKLDSVVCYMKLPYTEDAATRKASARVSRACCCRRCYL